MWMACIFLVGALTATLSYLIRLKRDIVQLSNQLCKIVQIDTNAQLTTITFDRDVAAMAQVVNVALTENRQAILETARRETDLKRVLTNISHDLRTPLTSVMGYLQMFEKATDDEKMRYTEIIHGRLDALVLLTDRLFEFTQVTENRIQLVEKKLNVASILRETVAAFYSELAAKGFTMDIGIPDTPIFIHADENALVRIIQNILRNVVEHGESTILVRLTPDGELVVGNNVHAIEKIEVDRLFDRFYTADVSRTGKNMGLGLAIVKELTLRMNGEIRVGVEEERLMFRIKFPLLENV